MIQERVRWGLLGTARINQKLMPAIRKTERSELAAVASRSQDRAERYASERGIPLAYGTYADLLADSQVDAVYIPLPNSLHVEWSIKAAQAGKHVLCEKPMALTPEDVDRMRDAARANGVVLQEAFMYRFHPQTHHVQELVNQGAIGDVRTVRASFTFTLARPEDVRFDPELGGGALWDVGCYPVSFTRAVLDADPVEVFGWQVLSASGVDLTFTGEMRFASGTLAQLNCSFQAAPRWEVELMGSEGMIRMDSPWCHVRRTGHIHLYEGDGGDSLTYEHKETLTFDGDAYLYEIDSMTSSILDGSEPTISLADSRGNVATLVALYESARQGIPITL